MTRHRRSIRQRRRHGDLSKLKWTDGDLRKAAHERRNAARFIG